MAEEPCSPKINFPATGSSPIIKTEFPLMVNGEDVGTVTLFGIVTKEFGSSLRSLADYLDNTMKKDLVTTTSRY